MQRFLKHTAALVCLFVGLNVGANLFAIVWRQLLPPFNPETR